MISCVTILWYIVWYDIVYYIIYRGTDRDNGWYIHVCGLNSFQLTWAGNQASFSDLIVSFVPPSVCKLFIFWTFLKLLGQFQPKHPYGIANTNCIEKVSLHSKQRKHGNCKKGGAFYKIFFSRTIKSKSK